MLGAQLQKPVCDGPKSPKKPGEWAHKSSQNSSNHIIQLYANISIMLSSTTTTTTTFAVTLALLLASTTTNAFVVTPQQQSHTRSTTTSQLKLAPIFDIPLGEISNAYTFALQNFQLPTQSVTSGVLCGVGDAIAQVSGNEEEDGNDSEQNAFCLDRLSAFVVKG